MEKKRLNVTSTPERQFIILVFREVKVGMTTDDHVSFGDG